MKWIKYTYWIGLVVALLLLSQQSQVFAGQKRITYYSSSISPVCSSATPYTPNLAISKTKQIPSKNIIASDSVELVESELEPTPPQEVVPPAPTTAPTQVPTPTPQEEITPEPTPEPQPDPETQPESELVVETAPSEGGHDSNLIFDLINNHRSSKGLPAFQKDDRLCQIAAQRAPQLQGEMFGDGYVHQGFNAMNHDFWITENMVYQPSEQAALNWWLNSGLHRSAIESTKHTHSCGICSGQVCIQLFSSFVPK